MDGREDTKIFSLLRQTLPGVREWIDHYVEAHAHLTVPVVELGFSRLSQYFDQNRLSNSKAVKVDRVQVPPLSKMGMPYFANFEETRFTGITYMDTFFLVSGDVLKLFKKTLFPNGSSPSFTIGRKNKCSCVVSILGLAPGWRK
jgi:hypothetical protein